MLHVMRIRFVGQWACRGRIWARVSQESSTDGDIDRLVLVDASQSFSTGTYKNKL